ncbi:MAG: flavodoxin-dependent (E)-4-hydroxy-3-methylbut-2-enyl-diphosphate synthase, partial [Proteobacteria bacterium]|nr:flavodoxin-dependent (E)-4-hydroxy-3-methylbut-2-enyl-diphosphate synthase [Pseudomonadota bacterium]
CPRRPKRSFRTAVCAGGRNRHIIIWHEDEITRRHTKDLEEKNEVSANQDFWDRPLNHQRVINQTIIQNSRTLGDGEKLQVGIISSNKLPKCKISFDPDFTIDFSSKGYYFEQFGKAVKPIKSSLLKYQDSEHRKSIILIDDCSAKFELREYYQKQGTHRSATLGFLLPSSPLDHKDRINLASILSEGLIDFVIIPALIQSKELETILILLQATRSKTYITDFIACPSCGRTLFDLESTTKKIKQETRHLKGLKIGIMGCIVNGPGEMADADFGYVGSGKGKIDLYFGQKMVKRGIEEGKAVQSLIDLIKERGMWQDPPQ